MLFGALLGRRAHESATAAGAFHLEQIRRVLLVRVNFHLGNLLLATPAFAAVRRALPQARIGLLASAPYAQLVAHDPDLDFVESVTRRTFGRPRELAGLVGRLRRERFDLVIDLARGSSVLGALCTRLSGGRWRVGQAGSRYQRLFNVRVARRPPLSRHKVDVLLAYLAELEMAAVSRGPRVTVGAMERRRAQALLNAHIPAGAPLVGVHLGGRGAKRWPLGHFLVLLEQLAGDPALRVALFAGPEEAQFAEEIRNGIPPDVIRMPPLPVCDFAAAVQQCRVFIGADSGPLHLAGAVGTPTIGIYMTATSLHYRQMGEEHRVLFRAGGTSPEAVVAAVRSALSEAAPAVAVAGWPPPFPARPRARSPRSRSPSF